jgi:hypothetical protein
MRSTPTLPAAVPGAPATRPRPIVRLPSVSRRRTRRSDDHPRAARVLRAAAALLTLTLLAAGCGGSGGGGGEPGGGGDTQNQAQQDISVAVASYDVAVSQAERRFLVGLQAPDQRLVTHGTVQLEFTYLGDRSKQVENATPSLSATAQFLPIPGSPDPGQGDAPRLSAPSEARGVYGGQVAFDQAGFWTVAVTAAVAGGEPLQGSASFEVLADTQIPDVGDDAPRTQNLTVDSIAEEGARPAAVDSRAESGGQVPDPELHDTTIAQAIAARRPVVALFATPVYCVSQFCGPITDMVAEVAAERGEQAEFIHVEIWNDHAKQAVNRAAAEWLLRNDNLQEPWLFVIGADGKITHRFDNVTTRQELEAALDEVAAPA